MSIKAHVIKLNPTKSQEVFFKKSCGVARFAYNWALNQWQENYKSGKSNSAYSLIKHLNSIKNAEFPWMKDTGKCAPQYAIHHVEKAFVKKWKENRGFPKFKKKGQRDSYVAVENRFSFKQKDYKIWIPRLGWVKCAENLRFVGKVNYLVIKRQSDNWFAVVNIETPNEAPLLRENQAVIGVDLGLKTLATTSDGVVFENPRALRQKMKSLKRQHRSLSRKEKGSKNREKQKVKLSKLYYKISCIRKNALHNATTAIVNSASVIVLENLNASGLRKNKKLSQSVSDASLFLFRKQIEYKAAWRGKTVIIADRWFPSSKLCSCCGLKKDNLKLSERTFNCSNCGHQMDRDLNAAINLANYGSTPKRGETEACGVGDSDSY